MAHFQRNCKLKIYRNAYVLGVVEGAGIIEGTGAVVCKCLFEYLSPVLVDMVLLISVYHNYQQIIQLVLKLFRECSHNMLCYFSMVGLYSTIFYFYFKMHTTYKYLFTNVSGGCTNLL